MFLNPSISPLYIDSCLKIRSRSSSVSTRSSNHIFLEVPRCKKLAGGRAFCVSAPKLWNSLPNTIKDASSLDTFKTQLNHIYILVNFSVPIFALFCFIFWYLFLYSFICVSVLFVLCILRKKALYKCRYYIVLYCLFS